jgi:CheY-like chemotaxis protein
MLQDNLDEMKKKNLEREKELIEKEKKEEEKKIQEIENMKIAIKNCKRSMNNELSKGMFKIIGKFKKEEQKWLESINEPKIKNKINNLKKKLEQLFDKLFENEKIIDKMNNKFILTMKTSVNAKELEKMNFIAIGTSGVGKSTLINEIFGEQIAKEGMGTRTTLESRKYESKLVPFISVLDTMGTEIGSGHRLIDVLQETLQHITQKLNSNDPNEHIHCILYCTTSNRFFPDELEVILKLREKYDGKKLPIVIVYTRATKDDEVESIRKSINDFLSKHGETLSNDIFGITFIPVNAREERRKIFGEESILPCFGLSTLMSTCFKKGEKSYRIAIKNALIQIGKNQIREYVNSISDQLANNLNYYFYLSQQFEPHFPNYISYCFERITDVEKQEGISNEDMESLQNYINDRKQEQRENKEELTENLCSSCSQKTDGPYICGFCKALSCENCYLNQFAQKDTPRCALCDQELIENKFNKKNNVQKNNIAKSINYMNILKSNLNLESRNSIHNYIDEFKKELIDEVNEKFDKFTKDASNKLYTKVLEKYTENISQNPNSAELKESMKSKAELKSEATEKLTKVLKARAIEDFLKSCTSKLYQSVVEIFKNKLNAKLDEFITNIEKNKNANQFFESCDALNDKKGIKLTEKIDKYIKELQIKEEKSQEKALTAQFGQSQMMLSNQGESSVPLNQGESSMPLNQGESSIPSNQGETGESGETKK